MRQQLVSWTFAVLAILPSALAAAPGPDDPPTAPGPPVAIQQSAMAPMSLREEAAMVLVGTALIAIAAAVKRSSRIPDE